MIPIVELYNDTVIDDFNKDQNGNISFAKFNRFVHRAQLSVMSWWSGNVDDVHPPEQISPQKSRDWLSKFISKYAVQVAGGTITKPDDYYLFRDLYKLKGVPVIDCIDDYTEDEIRVLKVPIELLDNSKFTTRCSTYIKRLKPENKSIAKLASNDTFEFAPDDLGSVVLEYYRYPAKAYIVTKLDTVYNNVVPDEVASVNLEFPDGCRPYIIWYLNQYFSLNVREAQFQQQNAAVKP